MELEYDSLYVGGEWIKACIEFGDHGCLGEHGAGHRACSRGRRSGYRCLRWARPGAAFDDPERLGTLAAGAARRDDGASGVGSWTSGPGRWLRRISSQNGMPVAVGNQLEAVFPALAAALITRGLVNTNTFEEIRPGPTRRHHTGAPRAARRGWAPSCHGTSRRRWRFMNTRPSVGSRLHGGAETVVGNGPGQFLARRGDRRGRVARGRGEHRGPVGAGTGAYLVSHPQVDKIAFTGFDRGRSLPLQKPAVSCFDRSTLELGASRRGLCWTTPISTLAKGRAADVHRDVAQQRTRPVSSPLAFPGTALPATGEIVEHLQRPGWRPEGRRPARPEHAGRSDGQRAPA